MKLAAPEPVRSDAGSFVGSKVPSIVPLNIMPDKLEWTFSKSSSTLLFPWTRYVWDAIDLALVKEIGEKVPEVLAIIVSKDEGECVIVSVLENANDALREKVYEAEERVYSRIPPDSVLDFSVTDIPKSEFYRLDDPSYRFVWIR